MAKPETQELPVPVTLVSLTGTSWLAITKLGGVQCRGNRSTDPVEAVQSLFLQMGQPHNDTATMAIELLALAGTSLDEVGAAIGPSTPTAGDGGPELDTGR